MLLQQGKGADAGATFGGGGNTMFGASGADNFLTRVTTIVAFCFMFTSVFLAVGGKHESGNKGALFDSIPAEKPAPAAPAPFGGAAPNGGTATEGAPAAAPLVDGNAATVPSAEGSLAVKPDAQEPQANAAPATEQAAPAAEAAPQPASAAPVQNDSTAPTGETSGSKQP